MKAPQKRWVKIETLDRYDFVGSIDKVLEQWNKLKERHGSGARIDMELETYPYSDSQHIEITISRLETDEEFEARLFIEQRQQEAYAKEEYNRYLQLKAKYEKEQA